MRARSGREYLAIVPGCRVFQQIDLFTNNFVGFSSKVIFWKKIQRGWELLQGEVAIIALL